MLNFKSWERAVHEGTGISFEVRRLNYAQSTDIKSMLSAAHAEFIAARAYEADPVAYAAAMRRAYAALDPTVARAALADHVKPGSIHDALGEPVALDGVPITTGDGLFEIADENLILFALGRLVELASLSASVGKASSSRSTSASEPAGTCTASPAPSTVSVGGPVPSTVPASQSGSGSSIGAA